MHDLLVLRHRGIPAFHGTGATEAEHRAEFSALEAGNTYSSPDCWNRIYSTDAHCVMYSWHLPIRLSKYGLHLVKEQGYEPNLNWVLVDVDNVIPGTVTKQPWANERDFLGRLAAIVAYPVPELDFAGVYQTSNGFRLVWPLATPIPVSFGDSFLRQFIHYLLDKIPFASLSLKCDILCDWTRLMRMPRVRRQDTGADQMLYLNLDHMQPLSWTPPEPLTQISTKAFPRLNNIDNYDLKPVDPEILHLLRGSPFYDAIVAQRPLSVPTDRTPAMMRAIGSVCVRLNTTDPNEIFQVLAPSILADNSVGPTGRPAPTLADLARACEYSCRNRIAELGTESSVKDTLLYNKFGADLLAATTPQIIIPPPALDVAQEETNADLEQTASDVDNDFRFQTANEKRRLLEDIFRNKYGVSDVGWLRFLEVTPDKLDKVTGEACGGGFKPSIRNLCLILQNDPRWRSTALYWNELANDIYYSTSPIWPRYVTSSIPKSRLHAWLETDMWRLGEWFKVSEYGIGVKDKTEIEQAVVLSAQRDSRHPVRQYLESLTWDGYNRLDGMLPEFFCVEPTILSRHVGRCWMISAVARVFEPGCKVDTVLVLGGKQGMFKSTAMQALCPNEEWIFDSEIEIGQKDAYQVLQGAWIVEWAELSKLDRRKIDATKRFLSNKVDKYRPSFERKVGSFPRQFVVFATSNNRHYLVDTDNRRWWTVTVVDTIDINRVRGVRDQLWAEAVYRYKTGEKWYLAADIELEQKAEAEMRTTEQPWQTNITHALYADMFKDSPFISTNDILTRVISIDLKDITSWHQEQVNNILAALGWEEGRKMVLLNNKETYVRGWFRPGSKG